MDKKQEKLQKKQKHYMENKKRLIIILLWTMLLGCSAAPVYRYTRCNNGWKRDGTARYQFVSRQYSLVDNYYFDSTGKHELTQDTIYLRNYGRKIVTYGRAKTLVAR